MYRYGFFSVSPECMYLLVNPHKFVFISIYVSHLAIQVYISRAAGRFHLSHNEEQVY